MAPPFGALRFLYKDPSGNAFAIFNDVRPTAMEKAYADPTNRHARRE